MTSIPTIVIFHSIVFSLNVSPEKMWLLLNERLLFEFTGMQSLSFRNTSGIVIERNASRILKRDRQYFVVDSCYSDQWTLKLNNRYPFACASLLQQNLHLLCRTSRNAENCVFLLLEKFQRILWCGIVVSDLCWINSCIQLTWRGRKTK